MQNFTGIKMSMIKLYINLFYLNVIVCTVKGFPYKTDKKGSFLTNKVYSIYVVKFTVSVW